MKKLLPITTALLCGATLLSAVACAPDTPDGPGTSQYSVYAPDGAPALSLCKAISTENEQFTYNVIDAKTISAQVTGNAPKADFCVLPVNVAGKLLGQGNVYQMLGTVTNGNMYFLTTGSNPTLTTENLNVLIGKTVGVVQLNNVPGLTLQAVLKANAQPYQILTGDVTADSQKINLKDVDAKTGVTPAGGCDYYLAPEPAVSAKIKGTATSAKPFALAGDLQELYGGANGYPQAVLVAKKSIISSDKDAVDTLIGYFTESANYLANTEAETIVSLLDGKRTAGLEPGFTVNNLNATVISRCSVRFTKSVDCKTLVNDFLAKLIGINATATNAVSDSFYYVG